MMQKYWTIFRINWQNSLEYRGPTFIYILGNLLYIVVLLYLWNAIYREGGALGDYDLSELFTYYVLQLMINSIVLSYVSWDIVDQIREGFFSNFLIKPVNYLTYWFTLNLSGKLLEGLFILIVGAVVSLLLASQLFIPSQGVPVFYFVFSLFLGLVLAFEFEFLIGVIAFWLIQVKSFKYMLQYIIFFFAGAVLPLDLFPGGLRTLAEWMPFQYLVYFPIQIFLGKEEAPMEGFLIAIIWIVGLYLFSRFLLMRGIRKYEAVGY